MNTRIILINYFNTWKRKNIHSLKKICSFNWEILTITAGIRIVHMHYEWATSSVYNITDPSIKRNLKKQCEGISAPLRMIIVLVRNHDRQELHITDN
ncbi:hypothetical protein Mgra_00007985 [Meloidogyne graminicola]|uniref:Uncharacterized protein n=1 Tax=Meloidogyne graminicola TaxID=189291 RepID=A0A8S9ZHA0_9BILA|nr:hypothetical protein Mgra_00007985 [Meloidogyne graminicola]